MTFDSSSVAFDHPMHEPTFLAKTNSTSRINDNTRALDAWFQKAARENPALKHAIPNDSTSDWSYGDALRVAVKLIELNLAP